MGTVCAFGSVGAFESGAFELPGNGRLRLQAAHAKVVDNHQSLAIDLYRHGRAFNFLIAQRERHLRAPSAPFPPE